MTMLRSAASARQSFAALAPFLCLLVGCSGQLVDSEGGVDSRDAGTRTGLDGGIGSGADGATGRPDSGRTTLADAGPNTRTEGWTYEEWVVLYLTNRVRTDPDYFNREWSFRDTTAPPPKGPLRFDDLLQQAGRFQAIHVDTQCSLCQNHASCCELGRVDGEVQCVAPAENCAGTGVGARVRLWSPHYTTENAAQGQRTPEHAIQSWIGSLPHFRSMNGNHTLLGVGQEGTVWVQDYGDDGSAHPVFAQGVHYRRTIIERTGFGSTSRLDPSDNRMFGITYYAPDAGAPREAYVLVDGVRHQLSLNYGSADRGSYEAEVLLTEGCHAYTFHMVDSGGIEYVDPPSGHMNAALVMDESCAYRVP